MYSSEVIDVVKATSFVGYISIADLTRMSDLIRARTYEAFFPLISIAVVYFLLCLLIVRLLGLVQKRLDPKRRKRMAEEAKA